MKKEFFINRFIYIFIFIFIFILYGFNGWNGDRDAYESIFYSDGSIVVEKGFSWLADKFKGYGFNYQEFQLIISCVSLLLLYSYINKNTNNRNIFLLFYVFCFFPLDYVLVRNFLSFCICLVGFNFLQHKEDKFSFLVLLLFAYLIHQSALCFIIFAFMPLNNVLNLKKYFVFGVISLFVYFFVKDSFFEIIGLKAHFEIYEKSVKSAVFNSFVHFLFSISIIFYVLKNNFLNKKDIFIVNFNLISMGFLIFYFESEILIRLIRFVLFFNICYLSNFIFLKKNWIFCSAYMFFSGCYLVLMFLFPTVELSVYPLIFDNLLFRGVFY